MLIAFVPDGACQVTPSLSALSTYPQLDCQLAFAKLLLAFLQSLSKNVDPCIFATLTRLCVHVQLVQKKALNLSHVRHFVLDECDKMLENIGKLVLWRLSLVCWR